MITHHNENRVSDENLKPLVQAGAAFGGAALGTLLTKQGSALSSVLGGASRWNC